MYFNRLIYKTIAMRDFFWWCAGVHKETLIKYPQEQNKYISIGATIFFTGLFAALAGGYALYFVFSGSDFAFLYALIFGLLWGLAIFNLDRYIVLSMDKSNTLGKQLLQALPRILLAILIGLIISRPLELKIFDKEIREHLRAEYLIAQQAKIDTLNRTFQHKYETEYRQLQSIKSQTDSMDQNIKSAREQLNHEIFGKKTDETSGVMGYGPYAKMKENELNKQQANLDSLRARIQQKETELLQRKTAEGLMDQRILSDKSLDSAINVAGFADRNAALSNLHIRPDGTINKSTEYAVIFIALLFIFFECLPVLVKLMSNKDVYDHAIKNQKQIHNYESDTFQQVEKKAIDKIEDYRIEASIQRRMDNLQKEFE